jgi:hypothetical protein
MKDTRTYFHEGHPSCSVLEELCDPFPRLHPQFSPSPGISLLQRPSSSDPISGNHPFGPTHRPPVIEVAPPPLRLASTHRPKQPLYLEMVTGAAPQHQLWGAAATGGTNPPPGAAAVHHRRVTPPPALLPSPPTPPFPHHRIRLPRQGGIQPGGVASSRYRTTVVQ